MLRKTLTILSLIGLLLTAGVWGVGSFYSVAYNSETYTVGVEDYAFVITVFARGSLLRSDDFPADGFGLVWSHP